MDVRPRTTGYGVAKDNSKLTDKESPSTAHGEASNYRGRPTIAVNTEGKLGYQKPRATETIAITHSKVLHIVKYPLTPDGSGQKVIVVRLQHCNDSKRSDSEIEEAVRYLIPLQGQVVEEKLGKGTGSSVSKCWEFHPELEDGGEGAAYAIKRSDLTEPRYSTQLIDDDGNHSGELLGGKMAATFPPGSKINPILSHALYIVLNRQDETIRSIPSHLVQYQRFTKNDLLCAVVTFTAPEGDAQDLCNGDCPADVFSNFRDGVLDAIVHCHEGQVPHGDLKLENILMLDKKGSAAVTDFGLAKQLSYDPADKKKDKTNGYTPDHLPPEYAKKSRIVRKMSLYDYDVWAYGLCLAMIATGNKEIPLFVKQFTASAYSKGVRLKDFLDRNRHTSEISKELEMPLMTQDTIALLDYIFRPELERPTAKEVKTFLMSQSMESTATERRKSPQGQPLQGAVGGVPSL
ncbi:protein kinase domain-containing protein [Endozoicomonas atrinae]|uniref:protein kinase domain-containing protein n=1 Tax=Endozoicomonas atrinae TaxID=1333660 RepID=UPI003B010001